MSRRRDPAVTKIVHLPWRSTDVCPCGSGDTYGRCCRQLSGSPYKTSCNYKPSGASTAYSHPSCYMNWTRNCSRAISGEHLISETVLSILNPTALRIAGLEWQKGETRDLPIKALRANVLCVRHNSAWSQLDAMAGRFFRALAELYDDLGRRTLSRKPIWHLFSGEELELWLLKTILGFFHAGVLSKDGRKIGDVQTVMNLAIEAAYRTGRLIEPCGIYVLKDVTLLAQCGSLDFASLSDERDERHSGLPSYYDGAGHDTLHRSEHAQSTPVHSQPFV